jgi:hypothetical protein
VGGKLLIERRFLEDDANPLTHSEFLLRDIHTKNLCRAAGGSADRG